MSTPEPNPEKAQGPGVLPRIRVAPSRNQKQRSKLKQIADDAAAEEQPPVAPPPPPPAAKPVSEPPRRVKLKRSGQMHEDMTGPMPPPERPKDEAEY